MPDKDILAAIDREIARLTTARQMLTEAAPGKTGVPAATRKTAVKLAAAPVKAKRQLSAEGRERIAEAQRKRWAASKKAAKSAARKAAR